MNFKCRNFYPLTRSGRAIAVIKIDNFLCPSKGAGIGPFSGGSSSTYKCATDFSVIRAQSLGSRLQVSVRVSAVRGLCAERGAKEDEFLVFLCPSKGDRGR